MKIVVDVFGGDNAPLAILKGCALAAEEYGVDLILTGDENKIRQSIHENRIPSDHMEIVHAPQVIPVEANPSNILKEYRDCSMAVGLQLLADDKGDTFVSAGSTGALVVGSSLIVKRMRGVKRAALGTIIPTVEGCYILMDAGANIECRPEMLMQFGIMGSAYMKKLGSIPNPRVGLVNIGAEETKGLELQKETFPLLKAAPVNFIGNVEARGLPLHECDVAVTDGFTGNVVLKLTEGMGKMMANELKDMFYKSSISKFAALLMKNALHDFKKKMDYTEHGGAPLLGIAKPVIKAHGSSDANAIKNAIRQAKECVERDVIGQIRDSLDHIKMPAAPEME